MGRWSWGWKTTADGLRSIDINWLLKTGKYKPGDFQTWRNITWTSNSGDKNYINYDIDFCSLTPTIRFHYQVWRSGEEDTKTSIDYRVTLTTPCHIGGYRYWFICPRNYCGRRVGKLYLMNKYFLCRHCHNLTYESRNENKRYRMLSKIFDYEAKQEKMWEKMRITHYRGKPTKRYLKYLSLDMRLTIEEKAKITNGQIF
jgi:hypothetical protein